MGFDGLTPADGIDALVALAFDVDLIDIDTEHPGNSCDDLILAGVDARRFENDGGVEVGQLIPKAANAPDGFSKKGG